MLSISMVGMKIKVPSKQNKLLKPRVILWLGHQLMITNRRPNKAGQRMENQTALLRVGSLIHKRRMRLLRWIERFIRVIQLVGPVSSLLQRGVHSALYPTSCGFMCLLGARFQLVSGFWAMLMYKLVNAKCFVPHNTSKILLESFPQLSVLTTSQ